MVVYKVFLLILLMTAVAFQSYFASAVIIEDLVTCDWDGVGFYVSVKRDAIQKKLDDYYNSVSDQYGDGPRLFVPEDPVLPEIHNNDKHPVYIDFGFIISHDFDEYLENNRDPCVSTSGLEVAVTIPLLAGAPNGPPIYAVALNVFYERSRGDIPKINFLYPYVPVDEISFSDGSAYVRNGSDEMKISFKRSGNSCKPPTLKVKEEFNDFVFSDSQFGLPEPDYSFCNRHSFESQFCSKAEGIKCGINRYAPNMCQVWRPNNFGACATTVTMENITSGFRDIILLGDDDIDILASESYYANGSIALKYPCQE